MGVIQGRAAVRQVAVLTGSYMQYDIDVVGGS